MNADAARAPVRTRWAAVGAALAVAVGAGGYGMSQATSVRPLPQSSFVPITPCRWFDTRPDFQVGERATPLGSNETYTIRLSTDRATMCSFPAHVTALAVNVTAVDPTMPTFLTLYPAGTARPQTSQLNPAPGQPPTPNAATVGLSPDGSLSVYNRQGTVHVFVDIAGYYTDSSGEWQVTIPAADFENDSTSDFPKLVDDGWRALVFDDDTPGSAHFAFTLPEDHQTGQGLRGHVDWQVVEAGFGSVTEPCRIPMRAERLVTIRNGHAPGFAEIHWDRGLLFPGVVWLDVTPELVASEVVQRASFTTWGPPLEAGDTIEGVLAREAAIPPHECSVGLAVYRVVFENF